MAIQFPNSPVFNQTVNINGFIYKWNGSSWESQGSASGGTAQSVAGINKLQSHLGDNNVRAVLSNGTSTFSYIGSVTLTNLGTIGGVSPTRGSYATRKKFTTYTATAATTAIAEARIASNEYTIGGDTSRVGGFYLQTRFSIFSGSTHATRRMFAGMCSLTANSSDSALSHLVNYVGIGAESSDTNLRLVYNNSAGTPVSIDLGASFPKSVASGEKVYELILRSYTGTNRNVDYVFSELVDQITVSGTLSDNGTNLLPSSTTGLNFKYFSSAGGVSSAIGIGINSIYLESPFD